MATRVDPQVYRSLCAFEEWERVFSGDKIPVSVSRLQYYRDSDLWDIVIQYKDGSVEMRCDCMSDEFHVLACAVNWHVPEGHRITVH